MTHSNHMFPAEHRDKFDQLRAHFLSGLPTREAELEDLTAALLTRPDSPEALEALFVATHKLAGICSTYGLNTAGALAARAERKIEETQGDTLSETQLYELLAEIELLSDELRRVFGNAGL